MVTDIDDPKLTVRDLLRSNWDNSGLPTQLVDDDIHVGWWDAGKDYPQISVSNTEESPFGGGRTGYNGLQGDGSGPIQTINGSVTVNCWGGTRNDYSESGLEQKQAHEMADEVERIIMEHHTPSGGLTSLSITEASDVIDTEAEPVVHRVNIQVSYTYTRTQN